MASERELAEAARAWPFEEARKLVARLGGPGAEQAPEKGYVLLQTGYGPSGLPHIGTFGEVVRTTMVRRAFGRLSEVPTRLFCFSDDMDGLRKVPDNIPNQDMVAGHLGKPLTAIPDPFGTHESFGHHNNARLRAFLDDFGFDYEFQSATECYRSGRFDAALLKVLEHYDEVMAIMLPTLGAERRQTYSPFLPVCPETGRVLQAPVVERDLSAGTIVYLDEDRGDAKVEVPVTGGHCKLQWKPDWARQGPDRLGQGRQPDLQGAGRPPARGLQLRALPRRKGREDLQVQGQRADRRGVADLRAAGEPGSFHVQQAARGQAALLRRHPARGGRLPGPSGRLRQGSGPRKAPREPGLAHP
jgi:hypothetical protein